MSGPRASSSEVMAGIGKHCWSCGRKAPREAVDLEAVLVPRSAARGGPVTLYRCPGCGLMNLVERNAAGEILLSPPLLAGIRTGPLRGETRYAARRWAREHLREREEFLALRGEAPPGSGETEPEAGEAEPGRDPSPAAGELEPAPAGADPDPSPPGPPGKGGRGLAETRAVLEAYETLGLPLHATPEEIHRRYRELSRKCHPDRVADLDEEIRRVAERRFRRLKRAYDLLCR